MLWFSMLELVFLDDFEYFYNFVILLFVNVNVS